MVLNKISTTTVIDTAFLVTVETPLKSTKDFSRSVHCSKATSILPPWRFAPTIFSLKYREYVLLLIIALQFAFVWSVYQGS